MRIRKIHRASSPRPEEGAIKPWFPGWFHERFGDHIAQISVDTTLKMRSAVKDVSRARHGYVADDVEKLAAKFLTPPMGISDHRFALGDDSEDEGRMLGSSVPGHVGSDAALIEYIRRYPEEWGVVQKALGLPRNKGKHASAYVLANRPIKTFIPLTTVTGEQVTAFTAAPVEAAGGVKMDYLVVSQIKDIQDAIRIVQGRHGGEPTTQVLNGIPVPPQRLVPLPAGGYADIADLPPDPSVFKEIALSRTDTVFQLNTPAAKKWLEHFSHQRPDGSYVIDSVKAIADFTALDRPGPLDAFVINPDWDGPPDHQDARHNMLVEYARRKRGATPSPEIQPIMEKMLPETAGILIYQEQVQRVYQELTGCTGVEAEGFRAAVAKKQKEDVDKAYPFFMAAAEKQIGKENAQQLWDAIETFSAYGFNKAHATAYALTAYACAWLKFHYPLEWWTAVLGNATKKAINEKFWPYCHKFVLLPDIRLSGHDWQIEGDKIRAPLSLLNGVGEKAFEQLCKYAPYDSILDFAKAIKKHQDSNPKARERKVKGEDRTETVEGPGLSSIHRSTVYRMIVAGTMSSLFPQNYTVGECIAAYDAAMTEVFGKKYTKTKKAVFPTLDTYGRYQIKKEVLPTYGEDLRVLVVKAGLPAYLKLYDGKRLRFSWVKWSRTHYREIETEDPVIGWERLESLVEATTVPPGGFSCAVVCYVDAREFINYGPNKSKRGLKLHVDVGGGRLESVLWPRGDKGLPPGANNLEPGCIAVLALERNDSTRGFNVRAFEVIRAPQKLKEEDVDAKDSGPADHNPASK